MEFLKKIFTKKKLKISDRGIYKRGPNGYRFHIYVKSNKQLYVGGGSTLEEVREIKRKFLEEWI